MQVRYANNQDEAGLRALWKACFPEEEDSFTEYFFTRLYKPDGALVCAHEGRITAMLHMMPFEISLGGRVLSASYIYGVGTDPAFRNRGLSGELIRRAFGQMHEKNIAVAVLIPQQAWLFDFYRKFGFEPVFAIEKQALSPESISQSTDLPVRRAGSADIARLDLLYTQAMGERAHIVRAPSHWEDILQEAELSGGAVLLADDRAYAVCPGDGMIAESLGHSDAVRACISAAAEPGTDVTLFSPARPGRGLPFGCARIVDAQACLTALGAAREARVAVSDGICPWNVCEMGPETAPARLEWTQAQLVQAVFCGNLSGHTDAGCLPAYMNLMHN